MVLSTKEKLLRISVLGQKLTIKVSQQYPD